MVESPQMSVRIEVENHVYQHWSDRNVADWVIKNLPLLEHGYNYPQCPIFNLDLNQGLIQTNQETSPLENFKNTHKIVLSGGFEGTRGHLHSLYQLSGVGALSMKGKFLTVLMLEPDSYICERKGRKPIINLQQRKELWSTSGLVDAIILLPEKERNEDMPTHYHRIHEHIAPASWCASIENPRWYEIITRQDQEAFDTTRLLEHYADLHTSFLDSTMGLNASEVRKRLIQHVINLAKDNKTFNPQQTMTTKERVEILFLRLVNGL